MNWLVCLVVVVLMAIAVAVTFSVDCVETIFNAATQPKSNSVESFHADTNRSGSPNFVGGLSAFGQSIERNYLPIWCVRGHAHRHINFNHSRRCSHFVASAMCTVHTLRFTRATEWRAESSSCAPFPRHRLANKHQAAFNVHRRRLFVSN